MSDAQRLRALWDENGKLKRLLTDATLDLAIGTPSIQETMARVVLEDLLRKP